MPTRIIVIAALLFSASTVVPAAGQIVVDRSHILGAGVQISYPFDDFGDDYNTGFGIQAMLDYPLIPLFHICSHGSWNSFSRAGGGDSATVWELTGGGRVVLGAFFMGGEVGWYDRGENWSWVPSLGLRFTRIEGVFRVRAVGRDAYTSLGVGWYF